MQGKGRIGNIESGGLFTVLKVREGLANGDYADPDWYAHPAGSVSRRVSADPDFGSPPRRNG